MKRENVSVKIALDNGKIEYRSYSSKEVLIVTPHFVAISSGDKCYRIIHRQSGWMIGDFYTKQTTNLVIGALEGGSVDWNTENVKDFSQTHEYYQTVERVKTMKKYAIQWREERREHDTKNR